MHWLLQTVVLLVKFEIEKLTKKTWAVECNSDILNKIDKSEARKYAELCYHQYDQ